MANPKSVKKTIKLHDTCTKFHDILQQIVADSYTSYQREAFDHRHAPISLECAAIEWREMKAKTITKANQSKGNFYEERMRTPS